MTSKPAAPPAPSKPAQQAQKKSPRATIPKVEPLSLATGAVSGSDIITLYGPGGSGKTTAAQFLPAPLFLDIEHSGKKLDILYDKDLRYDPSWLLLRGKAQAIAADPPSTIRSVVLDSGTVAEELAREFVVADRRTEKNKSVDSIEGFGWGKGWQYVYEEFNGLLADLDRIAMRGLNVCIICHDVSSPVPNPAGEDYIRWEPRLYSGDKKGRGSIRNRVFEWSDHCLFIGYDVDVEDGKGTGSGTRSIYTQEMPTHIAKTRSLDVDPVIDFEKSSPGAIWSALGIS